MDASVNMKMTPEEHRLIRDALLEARELDLSVASRRPSENGTPSAPVRAAARERAVRLSALLEKL